MKLFGVLGESKEGAAPRWHDPFFRPRSGRQKKWYIVLHHFIMSFYSSYLRAKQMAHLAKYTLNSAQMLFHHNLRHQDRTGEYVSYHGSKIDITKTHLNYRLDPNTDPNEFITQRLSEIKVQKRADVKVYCSWVLTVPQNLPTEKHREFFESAYRFFSADYGAKNIVMASVHLDETTPHMHLGFVPVVREKKNQKKLGQEKVSAKELLTRTYMKNLHKRLKNVLERDLNCRVDITIDLDDDAPKREYVPLATLKKQTEAEAKKLESLKKQSEELQGEIDSLKELQKSQDQQCRELTDRECRIRDQNAKLENRKVLLLREIAENKKELEESEGKTLLAYKRFYEFLKETLPARVFKQLTDRFSEWRKQRQEAKTAPER